MPTRRFLAPPPPPPPPPCCGPAGRTGLVEVCAFAVGTAVFGAAAGFLVAVAVAAAVCLAGGAFAARFAGGSPLGPSPPAGPAGFPPFPPPTLHATAFSPPPTGFYSAPWPFVPAPVP